MKYYKRFSRTCTPDKRDKVILMELSESWKNFQGAFYSRELLILGVNVILY
jgi:hypothetical protein